MANMITISEVQESFAAFVEGNGSSVDLAYADCDLLLARCVLAREFEVTTDDRLSGGVAVRATTQQVEVRPYLLRKICTNGAIMIRSSAGSTIEIEQCTTEWLDAAFAAAASRETLTESGNSVQALSRLQFDRNFILAAFMSQLRGFDRGSAREIMKRMMQDGVTAYSMMNSITSVARDSQDPRERWRLEEAGGALPAVLLAGPDPRLGFDALRMPESVRDLQLA